MLTQSAMRKLRLHARTAAAQNAAPLSPAVSKAPYSSRIGVRQGLNRQACPELVEGTAKNAKKNKVLSVIRAVKHSEGVA